MKKKLLLGMLLVGCATFAQDPVIQNADFIKIAKAAGTSECSCSHWINKDLGNQGETNTISSSEALYAIKFGDGDDDAMYQEVEVLANTSYKFTYTYRIDGDEADTDELEIRILKGSGYVDGYEIVYYTDATTKPTSGFGYETIEDVENADNNLVTITENYPGDSGWYTKEIVFDSGDETSIAIFGRGIGGVAGAGSPFETKIDVISLVQEGGDLSNKDVLASKFNVYPNPASGVVNISSSDVALTSVQVYNTLGKQVYASSSVKESINVSSFAKGIYFLKLNADGASTTKKLIVE